MSKYFLIILAVFVHLMFTHTACTNIDSDSDCAIIDRAESMLAADSLQEALNLLREDSTKLASKPPRIAMRFQLMLYNAMDQCFVPMKNDSMMKEVEKYYAINGNAYEQTLSRYLLAACYRDMNLYDECQKWANEAEEKADTLDKSFDYLLLYKLSGLKGELYVYKTADEVALQCYQNAAYYANKAKGPFERNRCHVSCGLHLLEDEAIRKGQGADKRLYQEIQNVSGKRNQIHFLMPNQTC